MTPKAALAARDRKASLKTSFCEVADNFSAYSILDHRHVPEVLRISGLDEAEFSFTAHLIPIPRGILETIYFRASEAISSAGDLLEIYRNALRRGAVRSAVSGRPGSRPGPGESQEFLRSGLKYDPETRRTVVVSVIDNLVKGAAGQAVQNLNLMLGFPETSGLL